MVDETDKRTRAPEGSVDVLATALGLLSEPISGAVAPAMERPLTHECVDVGVDVRLLALETRLSQIEANFAAVEAQLARNGDHVTRVETALAALQDDIQSQFRTSSRLLIAIAAGLTFIIILARLI